MGGQVSLLCIRSDLQCLDFGLSPSKHCRKVKAIFSAAGQLHTSVTQTDHSWPLIWLFELKYDIWAARLVYISPLFSFSVQSFCHFWMFGGFPSSENMPFLHPFSMHLFFSLLLFLLESRHGHGTPVASRAEAACGSRCEWEVAWEGAVWSPSLSPGSRAQHILPVPRHCCSAQKRLQILLVLRWWTSKLLTVWALGLFCLSYP